MLKKIYYICSTMASIFFILMGIAFPFSLLITVPWSLFMFLFPKKFSDCIKTSVESKIPNRNELLIKEEQLKLKEESISSDKRIFNEQLMKIDKSLSALIPNMSGVGYERFVGYKLLRNGWTSIRYTSVTGDFGADIIAVDPDGVLTSIQCKNYTESVGVSAIQEVSSAMHYYKTQRAVAITSSYFTPAAKELASKIGVDVIENFI